MVLELGCGSGILGNEIIPKCEKYVGIDLSFKMMRFFKNGINIKNIDLIRATIDKIPFQNNIFDLIIMNGVTMYIPNNSFLIQLIDEIKRVSKNKVYQKLIPVNFPITNYNLSKGKLVLELGINEPARI